MKWKAKFHRLQKLQSRNVHGHYISGETQTRRPFVINPTGFLLHISKPTPSDLDNLCAFLEERAGPGLVAATSTIILEISKERQ
jgi:hypothetical protein